jgi:uncharacterized protein (TIGR03118 family)
MRRRAFDLPLYVGIALLLISNVAHAQYKLTNLVSNQILAAHNDDPLLVNGWGIAHGPGPWWVSDEASGWSTLYDGTGAQQTPTVLVPSATGAGPGSPTGIVFNGSTDFEVQGQPAHFIFATLDGTISSWSPTVNPNLAFIMVNNNSTGAQYTGLAVSTEASGNQLYAADLAHARVDVFDGTYSYVNSFTDPSLPSGYAPFGLQDINGLVYVSFAPTDGSPTGFVDIFKEDGTFVRQLINGKPLAQPWGFTVAPRNFGPLSNTLLISNNTNSGEINAFNLETGQFVGTLKGSDGKPIYIDQLWGIEFGGGDAKNGNPNQLFFAAGPHNNLAGTFGVIEYKPE